jgi:hypothetical protein
VAVTGDGLSLERGDTANATFAKRHNSDRQAAVDREGLEIALRIARAACAIVRRPLSFEPFLQHRQQFWVRREQFDRESAVHLRSALHFTGTAPLATMTASPAELRMNSMNRETGGAGGAFVTRSESRVRV